MLASVLIFVILSVHTLVCVIDHELSIFLKVKSLVRRECVFSFVGDDATPKPH